MTPVVLYTWSTGLFPKIKFIEYATYSKVCPEGKRGVQLDLLLLVVAQQLARRGDGAGGRARWQVGWAHLDADLFPSSLVKF